MKVPFAAAVLTVAACSRDQAAMPILLPADSAAIKLALDNVPDVQGDTSAFDFIEHAHDTTLVWLKPKHARGTDWPHRVAWVVPGPRIVRVEFRVGGD